MNLIGKILRGGIAVAVLTTAIGGLAAPAAHADWDDRRGWHDRREWREHEYRERVWRERRYDSRYYYGNRVYIAPPVVYGPPPPPPGLNLFFNVR
jgi:hypothetical protein